MPTASILMLSRYKPARGGHAPGDIRNAFLEAIEDLRAWRPGQPEPTAEVRGRSISLSALCGLLWNCTDCLPRLDGDEVWAFVELRGAGYEAGRRAACSYGRASRALKVIFDADRFRVSVEASQIVAAGRMAEANARIVRDAEVMQRTIAHFRA